MWQPLHFAGAFTIEAGRPVSHIVDPACAGTAPASGKIGNNGIGFPGHAAAASRTALSAGFPVGIQTSAMTKRALPGGIIARSGCLRGLAGLNFDLIVGH